MHEHIVKSSVTGCSALVDHPPSSTLICKE